MEESTTQSILHNPVIIVSVLLVVILLCGFSTCDSIIKSFGRSMCGSETFQEILSPDNEYKIVIFQRDCGATTGFSTQVSILKADQRLPDDWGNLLSLDGHPRDTKVNVVWSDDQHVTISYKKHYLPTSHDETYHDRSTTIYIHIETIPQD